MLGCVLCMLIQKTIEPISKIFYTGNEFGYGEYQHFIKFFFLIGAIVQSLSSKLLYYGNFLL